MSVVDIAGIAARAREFRARLDAVKAAVPHRLEWYPYDSLANFDHLNNLLTGPNRNLLDLAGGWPVLDIGCADGDVSFLLESLGCAVHAIDNPGPNCNRMRGVRTLKAALGSAVEICELDLDDRFDCPCDEYGLALFFISEDLIARFGSITLSASVDGVELAPETYASPGEYVFRRSIPAGASERVVIQFLVSQALAPDDRDRRERGIIVKALKLI